MKTRKLGIYLLIIWALIFITPAIVYGIPIPIEFLPLAVFSIIPLLAGIFCTMNIFDFSYMDEPTETIESDS